MTNDVATKEFEAGLSLLHMMHRPSDVSASGNDMPTLIKTPTAMKKRLNNGGGVNPVRPAKKAKLLTTGSLLLAAAQQVDPMQMREDLEDDDDEDCDDGSEWSGEFENGSPRGTVRRNAQLHTLTRELNIDELREHFNKPIVDVAKEFGICTTFLKKICRRCGIKRWPHRQIRSLTRTIEMLRQAEVNATSTQEKAKYAAQIMQVEAKKRAVIHDPDANGKLERVKKSMLNRSGSPGARKNIGDATGTPKDKTASPRQTAALQVNLLHAVAAAAAQAASTHDGGVLMPVATPTTEAEAAAAEALLFSASPRTTVASIDINMPVADLAADTLPAMTPTASTSPESSPPQELRISPSHRKLLTAAKCDGESSVRVSALGSLQHMDQDPEKVEQHTPSASPMPVPAKVS